jgi:hypothetical protein
VQLETATACATPRCSANTDSSSAVFGPMVSQPERSERSTASMSSGSIRTSNTGMSGSAFSATLNRHRKLATARKLRFHFPSLGQTPNKVDPCRGDTRAVSAASVTAMSLASGALIEAYFGRATARAPDRLQSDDPPTRDRASLTDTWCLAPARCALRPTKISVITPASGCPGDSERAASARRSPASSTCTGTADPR